jgi:hypothetical protein
MMSPTENQRCGVNSIVNSMLYRPSSFVARKKAGMPGVLTSPQNGLVSSGREDVHSAEVRKLRVRTSRRVLIPAHPDVTEVSVPIFRDTDQTVDTP